MLTLIDSTIPNSSLPLNTMKLKWSFWCSNRRDWMASWPFEQGILRSTIWIKCCKKRHTRFTNILQCQAFQWLFWESKQQKNKSFPQSQLIYWQHCKSRYCISLFIWEMMYDNRFHYLFQEWFIAAIVNKNQ